MKLKGHNLLRISREMQKLFMTVHELFMIISKFVLEFATIAFRNKQQ